jgi:CPA2 family monovalent cation:H+ antiporter-2
VDAPHTFLTSLSVVLCVAAVTTVIFQALRQPVVLGYLLAGVIVGPHVPVPLASDVATTQELAELGVILLMFSLGLEFSLRRLVQMGATLFAVALIEVAVVASLGYGAARALGWSAQDSLYTAAMVAISSSTIVAKVFREQGVKGRLRDLVFGVLIVEDLVAILALATFTALSSGRGVSAELLGRTAARLVGFLVALLTVGMLVVPRFIRHVVSLKRPETTLVAAVGVCFATALMARQLGYSVALGAFLAGALVAESGEGPAIETLVQPLRDIFAAIFFVAVGMQIDPAVIARNAGAVALLTVVVVVGKAAGVSLGAFLGGNDVRRSLKAGLSLGQIGEFSFILVGLGVSLGAVSPRLQPVAVAVSAVTTLATPWLVRGAEPFARYVDRKLPAPLQTFAALYGRWIEQIRASSTASHGVSEWRRYARILALDVAGLTLVAVGTSKLYPRVARALVDHTRMPEDYASAAAVALGSVIAVPFFVGGIRAARWLGSALAAAAVPVGKGGVDLGRAPRSMLAVTLQLIAVAAVCAPLLAVVGARVPFWWAAVGAGALIVSLGVVFWTRATDLQGHVRAVVQIVVSALAEQSRSGEANHDALKGLDGVFAGLGAPASVRLEATSHAAGRTLASLDLRGRTGATVLVVQRGEDKGHFPNAHEPLEAGDVLVVAGTSDAIESARRLVTTGETEATDVVEA